MREAISLMILEEKLAEEKILEKLKTQLDLYCAGEEVIEVVQEGEKIS
jgi:hypothetical protein